MLAYVIVFVEITILSGVFWYVFLREPKPYKVEGDLWGSYYASNDEDTKCGADRLKEYLEQEGYSENSCLMCGASPDILSDGPFNQYAMRSLQTGVRPLDEFAPVVNPNATKPESDMVVSLFKRFQDAISNFSMKLPS